MALAYVGELPVPFLCPQLQLCIGLPCISIHADLTGAVALNASLSISPPTVAIYLSAEIEFDILLGLSVTNVPPLPTVQFDASVSLAIEASLNLSLSLLLDFGFGLGLSLSALLSAHVGIYAFTYEGSGATLGAALTTALASTYPDGSSSAAPCSAVILGAASPVAQDVLPALLDGLAWGPGLSAETLASLGAGMALCAKAETQAQATIQAKAAVQAKVTAHLAARASAGITIPTPAITLVALAKYRAALTAQLSLAPPKVSAAISATANLAASLQASAGFMASFGALLRFDGGMFAYSYEGSGATLGAALGAALASTWGDGHTPSADPCTVVVLAATDSFSAAVLGAMFAGV